MNNEKTQAQTAVDKLAGAASYICFEIFKDMEPDPTAYCLAEITGDHVTYEGQADGPRVSIGACGSVISMDGLGSVVDMIFKEEPGTLVHSDMSRLLQGLPPESSLFKLWGKFPGGVFVILPASGRFFLFVKAADMIQKKYATMPEALDSALAYAIAYGRGSEKSTIENEKTAVHVLTV